jgi:hypothetical protein
MIGWVALMEKEGLAIEDICLAGQNNLIDKF